MNDPVMEEMEEMEERGGRRQGCVMRSCKFLPCIGILILGLAGGSAQAQMQVVPGIATVAGNGTAGYSGDGGGAGSAQLQSPSRLTTDLAGNLYIADSANNVVRKVTFLTGVIATVAGNGTAGYSGDGRAAASAELHSPKGVAVDAAGNLYIADQGNNVVRKVAASSGLITTFAGNGTGGYAGDSGAASAAELNQPDYVALDGAGNLYIADEANNRVRVVNATTAIITTVAGNGTAGFAGDGGAASAAELNSPTAVVVNAAGYLYIADSGNSRVRKVNTGGIISTVAGDGTAGYLGDGGAATAAEISAPSGVSLDSAGNLYIADSANNVVRQVNLGSGDISTVAGNGAAGFTGDNGPAPLAELHDAADVVISSFGNLYIADAVNNAIRKVTLNASFAAAAATGGAGSTQNFFLEATGNETIASITTAPSQGGGYEFSVGAITGCTVDGATLNSGGTICVVPVTFTPLFPGQRNVPLRIVTGVGSVGFGLNGTGTAPLVGLTPGAISSLAATLGVLNGYHVTVDSAGNLYMPDVVNNLVRKVTAGGTVSVLAGNGTAGYSGDGAAATGAQLNLPEGLAVDATGNVYIADANNNVVRKVSAATGVITTVAGDHTAGYTGDGGLATAAELQAPVNLGLDQAGNLYIADFANHVVRKVAVANGIITTVAGNGTGGYAGDGGPAGSAELSGPASAAFDSSGNLYIADSANSTVRKVNLASGLISTVAGDFAAGAGYSGDGGAATGAQLNQPTGAALDPAGNLYIADASNDAIRQVNAATGIIATVAGNATAGYTGDGGAATVGELNGPADLALDSTGNLYIADFHNHVIRRVDVSQSPWAAANTVYGATSSETVSLTNIGNSALTIPPPGSGANPASSGAFTVGASSTCPLLNPSSSAQTLAAGVECSYAVDFSPTGVGALSGTVVLTDNSLGVSGSTHTIPAAGTGVAAATAATLSSTHNPAQYGQTSVTVTVVPTAGSAVPTGTVQFSVDGSPAGGPVALGGSGSATYGFTTLGLGTHTITAVYTPGSSDFTGSSASAVSQTVMAATVTAAIVGNPTKVYDGTTAATLTAANYSLSGFALADGATVGQTAGHYATATAGTQSLTATLTPSSFAATGSTNFSNYVLPTLASGSGTIGQAGSATSLSASSASIQPGQTVTLTATVGSTVGSPTSTVEFLDGAAPLGTATLSGGVAVYVGALSAGATHAITAVYGGDTNFAASSSGAVNVAVAAQDFTFAVVTGAAASQTVSPGGAATYKLVAAPVYTAFPGMVSFTLTGLPAGATYSFTPTTIAAADGSTNATLTVTTASSASLYRPRNGGRTGHGLEPMLLGLLALPLAGFASWGKIRARIGMRMGVRMGVRMKSCVIGAVALAIAFASLTGLNACGGSSNSVSTQPAAQTYTLTATATGGGTSHAVSLTLVVQ